MLPQMLNDPRIASVLERCERAFDVIRHINGFWPNFASTGFATSYGSALLCFPVLLFFSLWALWSMASIGPARKTFSTVFILTFSVPLYPVLAGLALAAIWILIGFAVLAAASVGPVAGFAFLCLRVWDKATDFVEEQRREYDERGVAEDITFVQLLLGIAVGLVTLCTFGVTAAALTLVKSPLVLLSCIGHGVKHSLPVFRDSGGWCCLLFVAWCFGLVAGVIAVVILVVLSALVKLVVAAIWPAYVSTGWLRFIGGRRREGVACCTPLVEGVKAGYQVLWAADLLTNACITMRFDLLDQSLREFRQLAIGYRGELSPECRAVACLPPVTIGLFQGSWELSGEALMAQLDVSGSIVQDAWTSFAQEMTRVGREALESGLLTEEFVLSVPPELVIGLPARVLLDTVERSTGPELVLANGYKVSEEFRPRGDFADQVWENLSAAREALAAAGGELSAHARESLRGALLAGGGDPDELPPALAQAVSHFDALGPPERDACAVVRRSLIAVAVACSREGAFKTKLEAVLISLTWDSSSESEPDDGLQSLAVDSMSDTDSE